MTPEQKAILQTDFNKIWERGKDKRTAWGYNGECKYRTDDGLKCFFGELIPDELYDSSMEGKWADDVIFRYSQDFFKEREGLASEYRRIQRIHDRYEPQEWANILRQFANDYQLTVPE